MSRVYCTTGREQALFSDTTETPAAKKTVEIGRISAAPRRGGHEALLKSISIQIVGPCLKMFLCENAISVTAHITSLPDAEGQKITALAQSPWFYFSLT